MTLDAIHELPMPERFVQLAAYHCDVLKVEEEPRGSNSGPWVTIYLRAAGVTSPAPWCASFVTYLLKECGVLPTLLPEYPAAVASWYHTAKAQDSGCPLHLTANPKRGDLFYILHADGTGHMGIVVENMGDGTVRTIEGNTNTDGSREGYEVCRRVRKISETKFIHLQLT